MDELVLEQLESRVRADYLAPARHYHSATHLDDCLALLNGVEGLGARDRLLVRLALLWHDVVYDPRRNDNEERSAERALVDLAGAGLDSEAREEVRRLILLTKGHRVEANDRLGALVVSIDLSILGAAPQAYDAYADAIRREYAHVPADAWRTGRRRVLGHLLAADLLYPDPVFRARFEAKARANMARELEQLG